MIALAPGLSASDPTNDAVRAVNLFNPSHDASFDRLDEVIAGGHVKLNALRAQLRSGNIYRAWAATYIAHNLARTRSDYQLLQAPFSARNSTVRAMAALALLGGGKKEAIPALIDLLRSQSLLLYWEPPLPIALMANYRLVLLTGADFGFDFRRSASERGAAIFRWKKWWNKVKGNIRWDARANRYRWRHSASSQGSSHLASPEAFIPSARIQVSRSDRAQSSGAVSVDPATGTITVSILFRQGSGVSNSDGATIRRVVQAGTKFLNGPGRTGDCTKIAFNIDARFKGPFPPGVTPMEITIEAGKTHGDQRSTMKVDQLKGRWFLGDLTTSYAAVVVAHEVSHVLELGDEYTNVGSGQSQSTVALDGESYMATVGQVLQRHLDALAENWLKDNNRGCQKYKLSFEPWEALLLPYDVQSGNQRTYYIGRDTRANLFADFWVNPNTGQITPAGENPCGSLNPKPKQMTPAELDKCRKEFPGGHGGNSEILFTRADPGNLSCQFSTLTALKPRFHTTVAGMKQGQQLNLQLTVGDEELAAYSCKPPASGGGLKHDVSDSMQAAGALSFTIAAPATLGGCSSKPFSYSASHAVARGTLKVCRQR